MSSDPEHVAAILRKHWEQAFRRKPTDAALRARWLTEERLLNLREPLPKGTALAGVTTARYRSLFQQVNRKLGNPFPMKPHSPRVGFATDSVARGVKTSDIRREGRWSQEAWE